MHYPQYPSCLNLGECALVRFHLELLDDGCLDIDQLLGLRRLLRRAAAEVLGARAAALFDPPLSGDPVAVRRFQKPAPGFVLHPDPAITGELLAGDRIAMEMLFLGSAIQSIGDLLLTWRKMGEYGLTGESLPFTMAAADSFGLDGRWRPFWQGSRRIAELAPGLIRLDEWLEQSWPREEPVELTFLTPVRLVTGNGVLRRPRFDQLFPFMLRRVTSMLHACCGLEPVDDPGGLLAAGHQVAASQANVRWVDWRETGGLERVGGMTGTLRLQGPGLEELLWVVLLSTLFGVGKGAAFGAGCCRIRPPGPLADGNWLDIL